MAQTMIKRNQSHYENTVTEEISVDMKAKKKKEKAKEFVLFI